jgi:hypothetical protein
MVPSRKLVLTGQELSALLNEENLLPESKVRLIELLTDYNQVTMFDVANVLLLEEQLYKRKALKRQSNELLEQIKNG